MMPELVESADFFISHRGEAGGPHADEIRGFLEQAGFRVLSQHPDIAVGDNILARMHEFLKCARHLIVVLTTDYDDSYFTVLELTSFMAAVAQGDQSRRLLVFRVTDCAPPGILAPFRYIDLVGIDNRTARREVVVAAARETALRLDFSVARRTVQTALRLPILRSAAPDSSHIGTIIARATRSRLHALDSSAVGGSNDFGASIREFLALYAGDETADMFGGRERQLVGLTEWLTQELAPPYRLIVGSAGRGKSMLLVRWALDVVAFKGVDVVFIPISIRCQTNTASVILQALVSRLARLCDEKPVLVGVAPEVLCDMARGYLQKERSGGRRTLLILDGLDEAVDKELLRGLLPTHPPKELRVLLAARPHVGLGGEDDEWRAQLGFGALAPASRRALLVIDSLDRLDSDSVGAMAAQALSGALEPAVLSAAGDELFRVSEGEPFILMLYLRRLVETGPQGGSAVLDHLRNLEPGLRACFHDWWMEQSVLWKTEAVDEETVVAVLAVLSTAHGPMTVADIQAVIGRHLSGYAVKAALSHLQRFVITAGGGDRVTVFHERLAEFVKKTLLSMADVGALERRFVDWGLAAAATQGDGPSDTDGYIPEYVLRHLGSHLHGRDIDLDRVVPLLRRRWADGWLQLEGNYAGFLGSANQIIRRAVTIYRESEDLEQRRRGFVLMIEAVLARSSAISVAESLPIHLLPLLIKDRVWTSAQALAYVRTIHNEEKKTSALSAIADVLDPTFHKAFLALAQSAYDLRDATKLVTAVAPRAAESEPWAYLDTVARFKHPVSRARCLRRFGRSSDASVRSTVLELLAEGGRNTEENYERAEIAFSEAFHVLPDQRRRKLDEALAHTRAVKDAEGWLFSGLGRMHKTHLLCDLSKEYDDPIIAGTLAKEALDNLQSWTDVRFAWSVFVSEVSVFAKWVFPKALTYARRLAEGSDESAPVLSLIANYDSARWPEYVAEVHSIVAEAVASVGSLPDYRFYFESRRLGGQLAGDHLPAFGDAIDRMTDGEYRWKAQVTRLNRTSGRAKHALAHELFERLREMTKESWCAEVMAEVVYHLSDGVRADAIQKTLVSSRTIRDDFPCALAFIAMAGNIQGTTAELSDVAMQILVTNLYPFVVAMASHHGRLTTDHFQDAVAAVRRAGDRRRYSSLAALARHATTTSDVVQYRGCVATIENDAKRIGAMFSLLGVEPADMLDLVEFRQWLISASFDEWTGELFDWLSSLNTSQTAFVVEHLVDIRDPRVRMILGSVVHAELHRCDAWRTYFIDVLKTLRSGALSTVEPRFWRAVVDGCDPEEIVTLAATAKGHISIEPYSALCLRGIEKTEAAEVRVQLSGWLLRQLRQSLKREKSDWVMIQLMNDLESLSQISISSAIDKQLERLCATAIDSSSDRKRILKHLASRLEGGPLADYVEAARSVWPPSERIELLATVFSHLSSGSRTKLFAEMTEWMETYYCPEAIAYMRMSEQCDADALQAASVALAQLNSSAQIGASLTPVKEFVSVIESWKASGRIGAQDVRFILGDLFERIMAHNRSTVIEMIGAMSGSIGTVAGVAIADVMNRMAIVVREWA